MLLVFNSCFERGENNLSKSVTPTLKSEPQVDNGFVIGGSAVVEVGLEISRKKDLLKKLKNQINRDDDGPCGEVMYNAKVKRFGLEEILIIQSGESIIVKEAHLVNDQAYIFDTNKIMVTNISIPYGAYIVAVVMGGKGVVVKVKNEYFVFDNDEPKRASLKLPLKKNGIPRLKFI